MKKNNITYSLFLVFVIILCLPIFLRITHLKIKPLKGAVTKHEKPDFSVNNWLKGSFQNDYEKYVNDNIGLRPWLIKIHNQLDFSLYNKANAKGVIRGKNDYLYEMNYLKAYNGLDFIGENNIVNTVQRLKKLQDTLEHLNKTFVVCLATGKGSFYPQYFPEEYQNGATDSTNYKFYSKHLKKENLNVIDFNEWFMNIRDTCSCILYPKYGIHWSYYGMLLAADSLIKYVEKERGIEIPDMIINNIKVSKKLQYTDYDIAEGMNLLFQMKSDPMCYPEFSWSKGNQYEKPPALIIADSFYWGMFSAGISSNAFSLGGFWFYNRQIYPDSYSSPLYVKDIIMANEIAKNDVVILMVTEANLPDFPWDFAENALQSLKEGIKDSAAIAMEESLFNEKVETQMKYIRMDKDWMKQIEKKAKKRKIPVDSMLRLDAIWLLENQNSN